MKKQHLYIAGGAVGVSAAFVAFRLFVRQQVSIGPYAQSEKDPTLGPVLVSVALNQVTIKADKEAVKKACEMLSIEIVPIMSLNIPTEQSIDAHIKGKLGALIGLSGEDLDNMIKVGMGLQERVSDYVW